MSLSKAKKEDILQASNAKASILSTKQKIEYYLIGFIIVLYFSYLLGACWSPGLGVMDVLDAFNQFIIKEHHFIVGTTARTIPYIFVFEGLYSFVAFLVLTKQQFGFEGREYGNAKWGDVKKFTEVCADHNKENEKVINFGNTPHNGEVKINTNNYWVAKGTTFSKYCSIIPNLHMLVIGPSGSGKTFKFVKPILSCLLNNYLVTDPKGELYKQTGQFMKDNGYKVKVINIQSEELMRKCTRFNPFKYLNCETDILTLVEILFKATTPPDAQSNDPFFQDMAQVVLKSIFYLMYYTYPPEKQTWAEFVALLDATSIETTKQRTIDKSNPESLYNKFRIANEEWMQGKYTNGIPQKEKLNGWVDIDKLYNLAPETASSVTSTLDAHCKFMKLDCVKTLLSEDEVDIINSFGYGRESDTDPYGSQKSILYIATSENVEHFNWILSMIYSLFFNKLYDLTDTDPSIHETLPIPLTFLMDEFANTFVPEKTVDLLTTMRSRGMNIIAIIQTMAQLKKIFPKNELDRIFANNMALTIILAGPKDPKECEDLSKLFSDITINKRTTGTQTHGNSGVSHNIDVMKKELLSPADIKNMNADGPLAICFAGGIKPLFVPKIDLRESPLYPLLIRGSKYSNEAPFIPDFTAERIKNRPNQAVFFKTSQEAEEYAQKHKVRKISLSLEDGDMFIYALNKGLLKEQTLKDEFVDELRENVNESIKDESIKDTHIDEATPEEIMLMAALANEGYTEKQLGALLPIIKMGVSKNEIQTYFNINMASESIKEAVEKIIYLRKELNQNEKNF